MAGILSYFGVFIFFICPVLWAHEIDDTVVPGWNLINGTHWQMNQNHPRMGNAIRRQATAPEPRSVTDHLEQLNHGYSTRGHCPEGMVHVHGLFVDDEAIEALQNRNCLRWGGEPVSSYCAQYSALPNIINLHKKDMSYCIDRFEYPNQRYTNPWVYVSWNQAKNLCESEGKRLCTDNEWTFACEGPQAQPYGFGDGLSRFATDPTLGKLCNFDNHSAAPFFNTPVTGVARIGFSLDEAHPSPRFGTMFVWEGVPSGVYAQCQSSFHVFDMNGNVDEWTQGPGRSSHLKGGWWGFLRNRCRPSTNEHGPTYSARSVGFRCCKNLP